MQNLWGILLENACNQYSKALWFRSLGVIGPMLPVTKIPEIWKFLTPTSYLKTVLLRVFKIGTDINIHDTLYSHNFHANRWRSGCKLKGRKTCFTLETNGKRPYEPSLKFIQSFSSYCMYTDGHQWWWYHEWWRHTAAKMVSKVTCNNLTSPRMRRR